MTPSAIPHSAPTLGLAEERAVVEAIHSGHVGAGSAARELEEHLRRQTGRRYAFAVSSGFHAMVLAIRCLELPTKSLIAVPVLTCPSVVEAVQACGHRVALVDVRRDELTLDVAALPPGAACVVAMHAYGAPLDADAVAAYGVPWIEDCATSPTTTFGGRPAGSFGTCAIFSLASTKYWTAGAGGLVVTDDDCRAARIADLLVDSYPRPAGLWRRPPPRFPGRLPDLNAKLALAQWHRLDEFTQRRRKLARAYTQRLANVNELTLPQSEEGHSFYRYIVRTASAAGPIAERLREQGIDARDSVNPWLDQVYGSSDEGQFPNAAWWRGHLLSLPIYPGLSDADVARVTTALLAAIGKAQAA